MASFFSSLPSEFSSDTLESSVWQTAISFTKRAGNDATICMATTLVYSSDPLRHLASTAAISSLLWMPSSRVEWCANTAATLCLMWKERAVWRRSSMRMTSELTKSSFCMRGRQRSSSSSASPTSLTLPPPNLRSRQKYLICSSCGDLNMNPSLYAILNMFISTNYPPTLCIYFQSHPTLPHPMLKFIEKEENLQLKRTLVRYHPQKTYGNSYESPPQLQTKHSVINQHSYFNPFLNYQDRQGAEASGRHCRSVDTRWTHKTNLSNLQTAKMHCLNHSCADGFKQGTSHSQRYRQEISKDPLRFRLVKGEFTEYLNKNQHYRSIGPLHGVERSGQRIQATKSTLRAQREQKVQQLTTSHKFKSELYNTIKSNFHKNSSLITQRNRIKKNRDIVHRNFRNEIERRKKETNYSINLPHLNDKQEIFLLDHFHRRYKTQNSEG